LALISAGAASANTVTVVNPGFESPQVPIEIVGNLEGWTATGLAGLQNTAHFGNLLPAYEGAQDGWMHSGGVLEQNVGSYDSSLTYTLNYHAGEWRDSGQYVVSLLVGSTVLASHTSATVAGNTWDTVTTLVAAPNASLSGDLTIRFAHLSGLETDIDAIALTSAVPEPAAWALLMAGLAAIGWRGRGRSDLQSA
jgi:hypothetical protein